MTPNFDKTTDGLLPAIVQDATTQKVLMLGYMNADALQKTQESGKVTFYSRTKTDCGPKAKKADIFWSVKTFNSIVITTLF